MRWRFLLLTQLILLIVVAGCGRSELLSKKTSNINVRKDNKLLSFFVQNCPGREVITLARDDLNDDRKKDLVVIYKVSKLKNKMRVVLNLSGKLNLTNELPAPVSNQRISFRDIDDKPPKEFIVQGNKGIHVGYAIFRIEGKRLLNLFGEGMEECC